jgi:hypothetical protein
MLKLGLALLSLVNCVANVKARNFPCHYGVVNRERHQRPKEAKGESNESASFDSFFYDSKNTMYPPETPWKDINQSVDDNKQYSLDYFMAPTSKFPPVSTPNDASST